MNLLVKSIVVQSIGIKLLMISGCCAMHRNKLLTISIVVQCIRIALFMISILVQCIEI